MENMRHHVLSFYEKWRFVLPILELMVSKTDEIAIKRIDEKAGEVYVHFPRVGYKVVSA